MNRKLTLYLFTIFLTTAIIAACSTTEQVMGPEEDTDGLESIAKDKAAKEMQQILASTRNSLSDVYNTQAHDMPQTFLLTDTTNQVEQNPFDGFRIQIVSTRNMELADSVSNQFSAWADTTIEGYTPKAYTFFRQPFYKVHVGDFHNRTRANKLSQLIKRKYPEAWVVHDRVDPELVPADTTQIGLAKKKSSDK